MEYRGKKIRLNIDGTSHSKEIRFSLDGIKEGEKISFEEINKMLARRSAFGKDYATKRKERDSLSIIAGIEDGNSCGTTIVGSFENKDTRSKDYSQFETIPRPSHIDYVAKKKYGGDFDLSGSANFSGRLTVALVACGSIAKQILEDKGIFIGSHFLRLYNLEDIPFNPLMLSSEDLKNLNVDLPFLDTSKRGDLKKLIEEFKLENDSFGGIVQVACLGDLNFIGGPYFERLQGYISRLIMSIPGTKGIEFGNGFEASSLKGSQNNDNFVKKFGKISTLTNNAGGINGGISNGMPIIFNVAFKPTSSIGKAQHTLNTDSGQMEDLIIEGRHDPAFILRAAPVVEAMTALCLLDLLYDSEDSGLRQEIDSIDDKLVDLFVERMKLSEKVGNYKYENGIKIDHPVREKEIVDRYISRYPDYSKEISDIYKSIFASSKEIQENIFKRRKVQYGLLGRKLGYSYSVEIHERLADYDYELIELKPNELSDFIEKPGLKGLNVTIPYKESLISHMDKLSYEAKIVGVINTIKFQDGRKLGFNTDFYGFKRLLITKGIFVKNKRVIVLGSGATSKTVGAVLKNMGACEVAFVSRKGPIDYDNIYDLQSYQILVNTTPVGTYPDTDKCLVDLDKLPNILSVVDVIYNPLYSRLVIEAKKKGLKACGGFDMLVYQAKKTVEIFKDIKISEKELRKVRNEILMSKLNVVLVGMPGSGKTTIGRALGKRLNKIHIDLDDEFLASYGINPSQAIDIYGEDQFRYMESRIAMKVGKMKNIVISTGGGIVTREENYYYLKQNAVIFQIDRDVNKLSTRNRPLSQGGPKSLYKLKAKRQENYDIFGDYKIINNGYFRYAVEEIEGLLKSEIDKF